MNAARLVPLFLLISTAVPAVVAGVANAAASDHLSLDLRYRYEFVDEARLTDRAHASTLRTRLSWTSEEIGGWLAVLELDDVTPIGNDLYDSTANGETARPVVADPEGTEVNQAMLRYRGIAASEAAIGRARINLDNQRFISGVGWRQNEQTFDSFSLATQRLADTRLFYAYIANVNRVFGPEDGTQLGDWRSDSHIMHAAWSGWRNHDLTGYVYLLDLEQAETFSNRTTGLRMTGRRSRGTDLHFGYAVEYARQADYAGNPDNYSAGYRLVELTVARQQIKATAGLEILDGDSTNPAERFVTPLATPHAFQGWADKFAVTPSAGVEDSYFGISSSVRYADLALVYHRFEAQAGGSRYGDEWDFSLSRKFAKRYDVLVKFARYDADNFSTDTRKAWLMLSAGF